MHRTILVSFLLFAAMPFAAHAEDIKAKFEADWSGLKVGDMTITVKQDDNRYEYEADVTAAGLLRQFTDYRSNSTASGRIVNGKIVPERYYTEWWRKKEHQVIDVKFANNGKTVEETANPPEKRFKRPIVPPSDKNNTLDPVATAFLAQSKIKEAVQNASFPQKITFPVFDARRRFDVELTVNGYKNKRIGDHTEKLLEIVFYRKAISGFNDKELAKLKAQDPTITFYLNDDFIPVMGSGQAPFGTATFNLVSICKGKNC